MKKGEVSVYFKLGTGEPGEKFEDSLRTFMKKEGFKWWASGTELTTSVRDIAFEKKK